jgi:hypothetical protein
MYVYTTVRSKVATAKSLPVTAKPLPVTARSLPNHRQLLPTTANYPVAVTYASRLLRIAQSGCHTVPPPGRWSGSQTLLQQLVLFVIAVFAKVLAVTVLHKPFCNHLYLRAATLPTVVAYPLR